MTSKATSEANSTATSEANSTAINATFTEDHPTWAKAVSILKGAREVLAEVQEQHVAIQKAHPGTPSAPGISQRTHLGAALQELSRTYGAELSQIARAGGMTLPEGLR